MRRNIWRCLLMLWLVSLVCMSGAVFYPLVWADDSNTTQIDAGDYNEDDVREMMDWFQGKKPNIDVEKLIPPITVIVDQEAKMDGWGYTMHAEATFIINKTWNFGGSVFANQNHIGLKSKPGNNYDIEDLKDTVRTPAQYVQRKGGVLGFPVGTNLPFSLKSVKGKGTGWLGDDRKSFSMNETYKEDDPAMWLERTVDGVRIYCRNVSVDDKGEGYLDNFPDLACTLLQFDIKEVEMQSFSKTFSKEVTNPPDYQGVGKVKATIKGSLEGVQADFTITGSNRGEEITFNASGSRGAITQYTWTFKAPNALPENIKFNSEAELTGKEVKVVLLEPVEVTLKVENGRVSHTKKQMINIQKRDWRTPFKHESEPGKLTGSQTDLVFYNRQYPMHRKFGRNVCALNPNRPDDGSIYYPDGQGSGFSKTWDNIGYTIAEVEKGPFHGTFYLREYLIKIQRRALINYNFFPGTPFYKINSGKYKSDLPGFFQARMDHERLHSDFLEEALKERDPAKELERWYGSNRESFREETDRLLAVIESELWNKHGDEDRVAVELEKKYGNTTGIMNFYVTDDYDPAQITTVRLIIRNFDFAGYEK